jgi:hypothetical protein
VSTSLRAALLAVLWAPALVLGPGTAGVAAQQPDGAPPFSVGRIREGLEQAPALRVETELPVKLRPTFKSRVDERPFVRTLEEELHKQFDLNLLQRQSAEWAAKCCGLDIGSLLNRVNKSMRDRKIRKTREQIARELAELKAVRSGKL